MQALTGPFARADVQTIRLHLIALSEKASSRALEIYRQLGEQSLHLAERQGTVEVKLAAIRKYLA